MIDIIYADNAATTKLSRTALDVMMPYLEHAYGNPSSLHRPGQIARRALDDARNDIADILNCAPQEIRPPERKDAESFLLPGEQKPTTRRSSPRYPIRETMESTMSYRLRSNTTLFCTC